MSDSSIKQVTHKEVAMTYQEVLAGKHCQARQGARHDTYDTLIFKSTSVREK